MINVKSQIYDAIKTMSANIGDTYPHDFATFPAIEYIEEDNNVYEYTDGAEQSSYVRYRFDIWANGSTSNYATELDKRVSALGLKRTQCMDIDDPSGLKHKQMRYEAIINIADEGVYHSN